MVVVKDEVESKSNNGKIPSINQSISWIADTTTKQQTSNPLSGRVRDDHSSSFLLLSDHCCHPTC
jgi:hypothetical protein